MSDQDRDRELDEAIEAGHQALAALDRAAKKLNSAKGWGVYDILAGGFFSSLIKHGQIDEARSALDDAHQALWRFSQEAHDVQDLLSIDVDIDQFNAVFDIAFDNFFSDMMVQSQINNAADQVDEARGRVRSALARLEALR